MMKPSKSKRVQAGSQFKLVQWQEYQLRKVSLLGLQWSQNI